MIVVYSAVRKHLCVLSNAQGTLRKRETGGFSELEDVAKG